MAVYELPNDLQEVYNKLRLSEEDFEVLDEFLENALVAIDNQKKYETDLAKGVIILVDGQVGKNGTHWAKEKNNQSNGDRIRSLDNYDLAKSLAKLISSYVGEDEFISIQPIKEWLDLHAGTTGEDIMPISGK